MKKLYLAAVLSFLLLITPALALNVTVSVDKTRVLMGENITLTGKVTNNDGSTAAFEYRAAVVAPKRVIVCDSGKAMTATDGTFTLKCKIPTPEEANVSGIPAALTRAVIPYKAGVAVRDPVKNETVKRHAATIIAVNKDKLAKELDNIVNNFNTFVNNTKRFLPECDAIAEKAVRFNVTNVKDRCIEIQEKINSLIANATAISDQAKQLKDNLNTTNLEDFRDSLKSLRDQMKDLRDDLKDIKDAIRAVRWETLKEVRKSTEEIKQDIEKQRGEVKEKMLCERVIYDCENSTRPCNAEKYNACKSPSGTTGVIGGRR